VVLLLLLLLLLWPMEHCCDTLEGLALNIEVEWIDAHANNACQKDNLGVGCTWTYGRWMDDTVAPVAWFLCRLVNKSVCTDHVACPSYPNENVDRGGGRGVLAWYMVSS